MDPQHQSGSIAMDRVKWHTLGSSAQQQEEPDVSTGVTSVEDEAA